ncbi:DUF4870 domain-containing protein [Shewanella intestini]|uniref:DUF4870 domain-containing protein n=1 Tax=Shewanella intestini TaxID=2017544 RepID=A0ABS5I7N3_9GAMM|nr:MULTISPECIES: DUF4870 domain-containing protein [Shewanella]MBR9729320.1 DUF4870 domain-containing protein [Shewanella intestini]MRG37399.1 DUF4870 domain-containing protein [Shewanella sp. XMDDZSB0408]
MLEDKAKIDKGERTIGMLVHASSLSGFFLPLGNVVGPLVVWLLKKDQFEFVDECGKNCINFKVSVLMYYFLIAAMVLFPLYSAYSPLQIESRFSFAGIALVSGFVLVVVDIICTIVAMVKATDGIAYRYPLTVNFIQ